MNDKKLPTFSVILPIYNVEKFLKDALDSLKNQTFGDFEAFCINDGSPDNSLKILEEYAKVDSRFKIISQDNQGQGVARNNALKLATGKYILFLDPDDFLDRRALELVFNEFETYKPDIVQFDYSVYSESTSQLTYEKCFSKNLKEVLHYSLKNHQAYVWSDISQNILPQIWAAWDKAYRREFLEENKVLFAQNRRGEDNIFSFKSLLKAKKIVYLDEVLYIYRENQSSITHQLSFDYHKIFENFEMVKEFLIEDKFFDNFSDGFMKYCYREALNVYPYLPKGEEKKFLNLLSQVLDEVSFKNFKEEIGGNLSLIEKLLSFTNRRINGQRCKVIRILFWEFKIKINH